MNKRLAKAAFNIVTQAKSEVPDSKTNQVICNIAGVGHVKGRKIVLTQSCRLTIEKVISLELGQPLLSINLEAKTRTDSALNPDEKWAKEGVFANLICFTSLNTLPVAGMGNIPEGIILSCEPEQLDFSGVAAVVLVENGEVLKEWKQTAKLLPPPYNNAVAIYRGHGENIVKVKALINQLTLPVGLYFDYDPAGFAMAVREKTKSNHVILIPDAPTDVLRKLSKPETFEIQLPMANSWRSTDEVLIAQMDKLKKHELAVMQEKIAAASIPICTL
jgi:hypothetical protein